MASAEHTSSKPESTADMAIAAHDEVFRLNREILDVHGFSTDATGEVLATLAEKVALYPPDKTVREHPQVAFKPFYFFFYGSLQVPSILKNMCGLKSSPIMEHATIKGWKSMKMGPFPALIPADPDSAIKGMCWKCEDAKHCENLRRYESSAYRMEYCEITTDSGKVIENGRVFVTTLDVTHLSEGAFDLEQFKSESYFMLDSDEDS